MPPQSAGLFRTTFFKVSSNGEIVREIKRNQELNSHRTVAGAARCNLVVAGKCPEWGIESCPRYKWQKRRFLVPFLFKCWGNQQLNL